MGHERILRVKFGKVYPPQVQIAERKERSREEVDRIISRLTVYEQTGLVAGG
jgi:hypothetical protein